MGQLEEYGGENAEYLEDVTRVLKGSEDLTSGVTGQLEDEETERILRQVERQAAMKPHQTANLVQNAEDEDNTYNGGNMDNLLSQEYDGQISLALPEEKVVEKQITGQMNIEDVLGEWERIKEANARKRKEETREWMLQQTGSLFAEFDQQSKEGVLEQLERGAAVYEERVRSKQAEKAVKEVQPVEAAENETMQSEVEVQSAADVQPETMILSEEEAQPAAETTTEEAEAEESEVEELEEIEELQEDGWAQDTADIVMDTETVEESPRPVNAAAKAVMAAQGAAAAAAEQEEEEAAVTNAEESEAADGGEDREDKDSGDAAEEQAENSDAETSEAAPADEPAAEEASAESAQAAESPVEEEEEGSAQTGSLEDTAALHARIREEQIQEHMRHMSREEKDMFAPYVPTRGAMRQLVTALDSISLSAFTGNVILTGAPGADTMGLARNMIRSVRASNNNFSGKVAKISGEVLNEKSAADVVAKVAGGALIVEKAGKLSAAGAESLAAALNQEHTGVVVFAMDTKKSMERLMDRCAPLAESFTARFDIASLDSSTLVKYGCQYAYTQEFAIDELGRLALHTRIEDMQTSEHAVTVEEVREIVDEAIEHASRASLRHFWDIILRRRYDEDDMIILRERDFI